MTAKTKPSLDEALTEDEYRTLTALTEKAERLVIDRLPDYQRATGGLVPNGRQETLDHIEYKPLDRLGRSADGLYDIEVIYRGYERDGSTIYLPGRILWDAAGAIGKAKADIEAERLEQVRLQAEFDAQQAADQEKYERREFKRLSAKYGKKDKS